jgi:arabinofuranan 3-O-arabinosyltransferase
LLQFPDVDARLKVRLLWALAAALAVVGALEFRTLYNFQPLGIDFLPLWTAGHMAWSHPGQIYDFAAVSHAQAWLLPSLHWLRPYAYPPTALLLLAPFGALPFWPALALWTALGLGALLCAGSRLAQSRRPLVLALMLVCPAVLLAAMVGQSILIAAALTTLAMVELDRRPRLAGLCLALAAAIKPQVALLAPVALLAGGAFEALGSAAVFELVLIGASILLFGVGRWQEWLASLPAFQAVIETTPGIIPGVITPAGAAQTLGLTGIVATAWRAAFALFGVAVVWRAFTRKTAAAPRLAALSAGSLLAAPYAMHYDGTLLVAAAVVMAVESLEERDWIVRVLALGAVVEVTSAYIGLAMLLAFAVLSSLRTPRASAAEARLEPAIAAPPAG